MGVDFLNCDNPQCGRDPFPDCGRYFSCYCGHNFCNEKCADYKSTEDNCENLSCMFCRKENATDYNLFMFLLKHVSMTREDVLKLYLEQNK